MDHRVVRHGLGEYIIGTTQTNIPSAEQRGDGERLRKEFENLSDADIRKFERLLGRVFESSKRVSDSPSELLADQ
jgi:hypothetical protein